MKNLFLLLFALGSISIAKAQNNSQQNLDNFENFIEYFKKTAHQKDSLAFMSCFGKNIKTDLFDLDSLENCSRLDLMEALLNEQEFDDFAVLLASSAQGFSALDDQGTTFTNNQNPLNQRKGEVKVLDDHVALRRSPSVNSACIARLNEGVFSGYKRKDALEYEDEKGILWVPISISVPEMGLIRCYIAQHLIVVNDQTQKYAIDVSLTQRGWRITGLRILEIKPSSLPFANL
ncbi:MAG: hypothetical protein ACPGED_09975 [Flavobacteriales bacterium]